MNEAFPTAVIRDAAERAESAQALLEVLRQYDGAFLRWPETFRSLMEQSGMSYVRLAARSGLSRNTLSRWCAGSAAPRSRESYVRLGFGFAMTSAQTSRLLVRCGGYPALYARDLFDAACIFLLDRGGASYDAAEALYARCLRHLDPSADPPPQLATDQADAQIRSLLTEEAFEAYVRAHTADFGRPRAQLRAFVRQRLEALGCDPATGRIRSVHGCFADGAVAARFEKDVSLLLRHGTVLRRQRLLSLGVQLGLSLPELDTFLTLAGMEPLCARNRVECTLIYALQQLSLLHPELELARAVRLQAVVRDPDAARQLRDLAERYLRGCYRTEPDGCESAADYLRALLAELSPEDADELARLLG